MADPKETWRRPHSPFYFGETAYHGACMMCECGRKLNESVTPWSTEVTCHLCGREYRIERRVFVLVESRPRKERSDG